MTLAQEVELLRAIPLFANVEASKLKLLAFASERRVFKPGEIVFREGDGGDAAYVVVSGRADVLVGTQNGALKVAEAGPNELIGEIAVLCGVPRTATVRAAGELVTLRISAALFFRIVEEFPKVGVEVMRALAHRLETTTQALRDSRSA